MAALELMADETLHSVETSLSGYELLKIRCLIRVPPSPKPSEMSSICTACCLRMFHSSTLR